MGAIANAQRCRSVLRQLRRYGGATLRSSFVPLCLCGSDGMSMPGLDADQFTGSGCDSSKLAISTSKPSPSRVTIW